MDISILTMVRGRSNHLKNLLQGLNRSKLQPREFIVVHMNEMPEVLPHAGFPIIQKTLNSPHPLPLSQARNYAAQTAGTNNLIFLDVDCIPDENLTTIYAEAFNQEKQLLTGPVNYLMPDATTHPNFHLHWNQNSRPDPIRTGMKNLPYELFWSLNFACTKQSYEYIGGFDENYTGYGAEDTDFAFQTRERNIPLVTVPAVAYHQHHASYDPPINHLSDILANAKLFHSKWGVWPMEGWLSKFEALGLIHWYNGKPIQAREPSLSEITSHLKQVS